MKIVAGAVQCREQCVFILSSLYPPSIQLSMNPSQQGSHTHLTITQSLSTTSGRPGNIYIQSYTTAGLLIIVAFTKWIYWMAITTLSDKHIRFWDWYHGEGRGRRMSAPTGSYRYCSKCVSLHNSSLVSNFHGCRRRKPFYMISWLTTLTILRQFTPIATPNVLRNAPSALLIDFRSQTKHSQPHTSVYPQWEVVGERSSFCATDPTQKHGVRHKSLFCRRMLEQIGWRGH